MEKQFVLFINLREYEQGQNEDGSPALGDLTDNFYCIKPENAEMTGDIMFLGYLEENGERTGVRLLCDPGYVTDGSEPLVISLKAGGKFKFAHTDRAAGSAAVCRIRGYNLRLFESDGHEHSHEHSHEHPHEHDHGCGCEGGDKCSGDCSDCGDTGCEKNTGAH